MIPARVAIALQADGWWLRSDIIWAKGLSFCEGYSGSVMPESVTDRPTSAHEHVFLLAKAPRYYYDAEAVAEQSIHAGRVVSYDGTQKNTAHENRTYPDAKPRDIDVAPTRNLRNVWAINPAAFPEAHFATFPPALVEPCVKAGTSERGCCPRCGAPWERVVEKELVVQYECRHGGYHAKGNAQGMVDLSQSWTPGANHVTTLGWRPTCGCPAHEPVPCTVLDPFAGAGTVPMVADRLGRRGVGVELSSEYCAMARQRCYGDAPLLAWAEASS
jgi:DNA modification methylase